MKRKILSLVLALAMAVATVAPVAAIAQGPAVRWNGATDKTVSVDIDAVQNNTRKNASGAKITSNAHSADFPGIYFIWDVKQKDHGYLKVASWVFDTYESFVLTSKESNTYWDFLIELQAGQQMTADGGYVFYIPKVYNNKNINMVFVSEFVEKCGPKAKVYAVGFYKVNGEHMFTLDIPRGESIGWNGEPFSSLWSGDFDEIAKTNGDRNWNNLWGINFDTEIHTGDWLKYDAETGKAGELYIIQNEHAPGNTARKIYECVNLVPDVRSTDVVISYDRYLAFVELWNDFYTGVNGDQYKEGTVFGQILHDSGGIAHYNALLAYFGADSLPPYWHFDTAMKSVYDFWADELEEGLMIVCSDAGIDLEAYYKAHVSNR